VSNRYVAPHCKLHEGRWEGLLVLVPGRELLRGPCPCPWLSARVCQRLISHLRLCVGREVGEMSTDSKLLTQRSMGVCACAGTWEGEAERPMSLPCLPPAAGKPGETWGGGGRGVSALRRSRAAGVAGGDPGGQWKPCLRPCPRQTLWSSPPKPICLTRAHTARAARTRSTVHTIRASHACTQGACQAVHSVHVQHNARHTRPPHAQLKAIA
jgi:hypothetical protein